MKEEYVQGPEALWIELGLDNKSEVGQTAEEEQEAGWTQPTLPGVEEL